MITLNETEWREARLGKATASRMGDAMATIKSGWGAQRARYRTQLMLERLTGVSQENGYVSADMQWGIDCEPMARKTYELLRSVDLIVAPEQHRLWITHPRIAMSGATPDAVTLDGKGIVEIKCPASHTHWDNWENRANGKLDKGYLLQAGWQLACMPEAEYVDHISFDPRFPARLQMVVNRISRSEAGLQALEQEVETFLAEVDAQIAKAQAS